MRCLQFFPSLSCALTGTVTDEVSAFRLSFAFPCLISFISIVLVLFLVVLVLSLLHFKFVLAFSALLCISLSFWLFLCCFVWDCFTEWNSEDILNTQSTTVAAEHVISLLLIKHILKQMFGILASVFFSTNFCLQARCAGFESYMTSSQVEVNELETGESASSAAQSGAADVSTLPLDSPLACVSWA